MPPTFAHPAELAFREIVGVDDYEGLRENQLLIAQVPVVLPPASAVFQPGGDVSLHLRDEDTVFYELEFPDAVDASVYFNLYVPPNLPGDGDLEFTILWRTETGDDTLNVRWQTKWVQVAVGESYNPTPNDAQTVDTAAQSTADDLQASVLTHTSLGLEVGQLLVFELSRLGAHANDTLTAAAFVRMAQARFVVEEV